MMRFTMPGNWLVSLDADTDAALIAWGLYRGRRIAAALSVLFNACTVVLAMLFYAVLPLQYVGDSPTDALFALTRHGAFRAMFSTMHCRWFSLLSSSRSVNALRFAQEARLRYVPWPVHCRLF